MTEPCEDNADGVEDKLKGCYNLRRMEGGCCVYPLTLKYGKELLSKRAKPLNLLRINKHKILVQGQNLGSTKSITLNVWELRGEWRGQIMRRVNVTTLHACLNSL
jgi:hypothetical protein